MLKRIRAEFKLTNAKKYLSRRATELHNWDMILKTDHSAEIRDLQEAATLLWRLSWMV